MDQRTSMAKKQVFGFLSVNRNPPLNVE